MFECMIPLESPVREIRVLGSVNGDWTRGHGSRTASDKDKTAREIAKDIFGAAAVEAKWHSVGGLRSQVRRGSKGARPRRQRPARS